MAADSKIKTPEEILELALKREQSAFQFYSNMLSHAGGVDVVRTLIEQLKDEELKHVRLVEKKLMQLRLG